MTEPIIRLENVSLSFPQPTNPLGFLKRIFTRCEREGFLALDDVSFDVNRGEVLGIIGRNGSGKSTVLRAMTGIFPTDNGRVLSSGKQTLLSGLGTGFASHQTGRENALIFGSTLGRTKAEMDGKMGEIIDFSELGDFFDKPLRTYSAGMKARLGLAVVSVMTPEILLIDEVLGVGDPKFREKSKQRILEMVEDAGTVVMVSHSFGLMKSLCHRIIHLHHGQVVFDGDPEKAIQSYYDMED